LQVVGHADDQATAVRIADMAAAAYVTELNAAGAGVGEFALQQPAQPGRPPYTASDTNPGSDTWTVALPVAVTVALAAGVFLLFRRADR
jgi:hypothetical protein